MNKKEEQLQEVIEDSLLNSVLNDFNFNSPNNETIELLLVENALNLVIKDMSELNGVDEGLLKTYYLYKSGNMFEEKTNNVNTLIQA